MHSFYGYFLSYLVTSFILGAFWHIMLFPKYYKKLAVYSRIEKPRFIFGLSAMLLQGIVFAYVAPLIESDLILSAGLFLLLESFMVFAEAGKQNMTSLAGFVGIQTLFCLIQTICVMITWLLFVR